MSPEGLRDILHHLWRVLLRLAVGAAVLAGPLAAAGTPEVTRGTLLLERPGGRVPAPALSTRVSIEVHAMIARVHLVQRFRNPAPDWTEGVYVFPLPDDAAVDTLRIQSGERMIEGRIEERHQAEKIYTRARDSGRRAGLVTQERPNVFTTALANIGPGQEVRVEIAYQQTVQYRDGNFSLRFPLVVGPRYVPGTPTTPLQEHLTVSHGWARATDQVPDAARITPPVAPPGEAIERPVNIHVRLDPGVQLAWVHSSYHPIHSSSKAGVWQVDLAQGPVPADRDFELVWRPVPGQAPRAALFTQDAGDEHFALLMLTPPDAQAVQALPQARDLVLVIDTSGSMYGASIAQAKAAVDLALEGLGGDDRVRLIHFSDRAEAMSPVPLPATPEVLDRAHRWVDALKAEGGTVMATALDLALPAASDDTGRLSQVVFVTDGAVGNEQALFDLIRTRLGRRRLFTVGIGSAPNAHFMHEAARLGRGSFTFIGDQSQVAERMGALLGRLAHPPVTDIAVQADGARIYPEPVPDLYPGEPLLVAMRLDHPLNRIRVDGRLGQRPWRLVLTARDARPASGIARLWARRRIACLEQRLHEAPEGGERQALHAQLLATALTHGLVSPYTALVAVDVTPVRPAGTAADSRAVKTLLPHGWDHAHVFGLPQTATPATLELVLGLSLLAAAAGLLAPRGRA